MSLLKIKNSEKLFNVFAKRSGKKVKFNKTLLDFSEAKELASDIKKAKIPSVNVRSIQVKKK